MSAKEPPPRLNPEQVFSRHLGSEFGWLRPPVKPFQDQRPAGDNFQFLDPDASDLPPELDFEQLPSWMR